MDRAIGTDSEDLKKRSALHNIERIQIPIVIAHGQDDVQVPYSNATRLREALEKDKPFEWLAKDSEGHGFTQEANCYEFYLRLAQFLQKHTAPGTPSAASRTRESPILP